MRRRDFIKAVAGLAATLPLAVHAQQRAMPVIGFLNSGSPDSFAPQLVGFRQGLHESGYTEATLGQELRFRLEPVANDAGALLAMRWPVLVKAVVRQLVGFDAECVQDDPGGTAAIVSQLIAFSRRLVMLRASFCWPFGA